MNQYYTLWHCWGAIDFWFLRKSIFAISRGPCFSIYLKNSHIRFLETALQSKCIHVYVIHVHFYTSESKPSLATPKSKRTLVQKSLQRPFFVSYNQHQPSILYSFLKLDVLDREANFRGSIKPEKTQKIRTRSRNIKLDRARVRYINYGCRTFSLTRPACTWKTCMKSSVLKPRYFNC